MTQIQIALVTSPFSSRSHKFRNVNGVVQIERSQEIYLGLQSLADHIQEMSEIVATLEDAKISQTEASKDFYEDVIPSEVIVTGWTADLDVREQVAADSLSWDD